jgi:polyamine oxidase
LATASSDFSSNLSESFNKSGEEDVSILASQRAFGHVPVTPVEMAIDYYLYDFEIAEPPRVTSLNNVEPIATFEYYGDDEYFVADSRGYEYIVHRLAEEFLESHNGSISDDRLKLMKIIKEIEYTNKEHE